MNKRLNNILSIAWAMALLLICANFTDGTKKDSSIKIPEYVKPQDGTLLISGTIYDEQSSTEAEYVTLLGSNSVGGIKSPENDSISVLDLTKIKELKVLQESYISPRYQDQEFILCEITFLDNSVKTFLVPRELVICAVEKSTKMEKAWYLRKISRIVFDLNSKPQVVEAPKTLVKQKN